MGKYRSLAILLILSLQGLAVFSPAQAQEALSPPPGVTLYPAPRPLSDAAFLDEKSRPVHLSGFRGRVLLLNFWATWCPSCREELAALNALQKKLGPEGLSVLPVSMDKKGLMLVAPFYRDNNLDALPMFFDPAWSAARDFAVKALPAAMLVSRDGWEIGRVSGWREWDNPRMVVFLRNVLQRY
ncbi:MAG TPA: TlpA disulfide reductase family protein [Alphaproteobacteria bacterium]|nr:TlpA disulfide reductase family protein [Alphaproteobacteria bacterium]